jgi:hypothetical protein
VPLVDGSNDDVAVATDKVALLPTGQASFVNYTTFTRGINGVIVDVGASGNTITAADFEFKVGDTADPATWADAPPVTVIFRPGAGENLRHRVELTWPDGAIKNEWLQVKIKANANTGLSAPDVFCFGNLIGDTNVNPAGQYATLADDYSRTKNAADTLGPSYQAPITDLFDHTRDGRLDSADYSAVQTNFFQTLLLLSAPA